MASANISFYFTTGAEIHWHQAHNVGGDAAAIRTLLSGLTGFLIVQILIIVGAYFSATSSTTPPAPCCTFSVPR